jgi:hypothetical protein
LAPLEPGLPQRGVTSSSPLPSPGGCPGSPSGFLSQPFWLLSSPWRVLVSSLPGLRRLIHRPFPGDLAAPGLMTNGGAPGTGLRQSRDNLPAICMMKPSLWKRHST